LWRRNLAQAGGAAQAVGTAAIFHAARQVVAAQGKIEL
jgi:hypothetical protein